MYVCTPHFKAIFRSGGSLDSSKPKPAMSYFISKYQLLQTPVKSYKLLQTLANSY